MSMIFLPEPLNFKKSGQTLSVPQGGLARDGSRASRLFPRRPVTLRRDQGND